MAKDNRIASKLPSLDDLFGVPPVPQPAEEGQVQTLPIEEIDGFPQHPFQVRNDSDMEKLVESVSKYGILNPVIVRKKANGRYELVAGHRRKAACEQAGIREIPCLVRELDDDEATILMCDSNLQREKILPSERAWAYKLKYEALKRQGKRNDLTSSPVETKLRTDELISENTDSRAQVQRYIRLTELIPPLLELVDAEKIAFRPAVELSYLSQEEQAYLHELIQLEEATPSLTQAIELKKNSQAGTLTSERMLELIRAQKPNQMQKITLPYKEIDDYFPKNFTPQQRHDTIIELLKKWHRSRTRENSR